MMAEIPVPITTGSGAASIAADVVSNISYQQVKLVDGTLGSNTALIVNADGTANVRISGSVATAGGTFTGSVSGTVGASIIGGAPVKGVGTEGSPITGAPVFIGGRSGTDLTALKLTTAGELLINGSVSGTIGASIIGAVPVNIQGSVAAYIIGGSIAGTFTTPNQSVSGTVGSSIIGTVPVVQSGTNITSVSGGVITSISGGISSVALAGANTVSVVGTVGASVIGNVPVVVQGSVAVTIISGSIAATFTPPANQSVSGTVQTDVRSSVAVVIIGGSIAASFTPPANQSVSGTVNIGTGGPVSVLGTMSVLGTVPVTQATTPWIITGSVQGSFSPAANQSVSGTVGASIIGTVPVTVSGPLPAQSVSGTVGASIIGQLPAGTAVLGSIAALQGTNPWTVVSSLAGGIFPVSGSVAATITNTNLNVGGSVVAFQGTSPWVTNLQNSSILAVPVGSVITVFQAPSIVGTYAEDAASSSGDKGFLVMGARNDTLSSVTSNDGDYSSHVVGPAGELIAENAPLTKWIFGTASMLQGAAITGGSVTVIAAQGASVFTYITGVQIANPSANNVLVSLRGATDSVIGFTMAPANGGSNIYFENGIKTNANGAFTASISGTASVYISAQGFISKT